MKANIIVKKCKNDTISQIFYNLFCSYFVQQSHRKSPGQKPGLFFCFSVDWFRVSCSAQVEQGEERLTVLPVEAFGSVACRFGSSPTKKQKGLSQIGKLDFSPDTKETKTKINLLI